MINRVLTFAIVLYLGVLATAFGQTNNQGQSFFLQEPGSQSPSGSALVYLENGNPLNPLATIAGPVGFGYAIAKPTGTGIYLVGVNAIQSIDSAFATSRGIAGLPGPPTAANVSLDGTVLVVAAVDSGNNPFLFLVDTTTDQVVGSAIQLSGPAAFQPGTAAPFCPTCFITISPDSKFAYVLTNTGFGSRLISINLSTRTIVNQLIIPFGGSTSVTMSPLGLLYVTAANAIYEIDPATLQITSAGTSSVFFTPFRLHFTPDGTTAYAVNLVPTQGGSLLKYTVASHQAATWPPFQQGQLPPTFDDVFVAGNARVFAFDSQLNRFADVSVNPFSATDSTLSAGPGNNQFNVIAAAVSNELPSAKFAFLVINNGNQTNLYRMDLNTNTVSIQNPNVSNYPAAQVVTLPPQTGAASFIAFNQNQILNKGGVAATLIAEALDGSGLPVFNAAAAWTTDAGNGAQITNAGLVTNANGRVQATVTVPNTPGTYNITLTVGSATQVFVITVPGSTTGGGNTQVTIVNGDGQIVIQNQTSAYALTILVTDAAGKPLQGIAVTFAITAGAGFLNTPDTITDVNGNASTYITGLQLQINNTILPFVVNASTQFGSVDFHGNIMLITFLPVAGNGIPQINILNPPPPGTIIVPEGQPTPDGITAQIYATLFPQTGLPIANVGISTYFYVNDPSNPPNPIPPPPASCVGSSLSGPDGIAHCTLLAVCQVGSYVLGVSFGNPFIGGTLQLQILPGTAQKFGFISGNNASGKAGQTLNFSTILTDGCGNAVPAGTPVTWAVKSGSATLVSSSTVTDASGRAIAQIKLGQTPGAVVVTVTSGKIVANFTVTNSVVISAIVPAGGSPQTGKTGQAFPTPITFQVNDSKGVGLPGVTVNFTVLGPGTVNPTNALTDASGKAQTVLTAGANPGTITVTATAGGFSASQTVNSVAPGPNVTNTSFTNAASLAIGLVPCGLGTVTIGGLTGPPTNVISGISPFGPLPFQLGGFSMTVQSSGGAAIQAPIEAVSTQNGALQQVNFQTPCEISSPGFATVVVSYNSTTTTVANVQVLAAQPGIFTFTWPSGKVYGAVIRALDGSYVTPNNYAHRGETYYVVVTGLGQATPAISTDSTGVVNQNTVLQAFVSVNGTGLTVPNAQYLEGQIGVYVVAFQIPQNATTGPDQPLAVGVILNGNTVLNNQSALLAGVQ